MKKLFTKKDHWRRYRLHQKVNKIYKVDALNWTITVGHDQTESAKADKRITELIKRFGYNIQTSI